MSKGPRGKKTYFVNAITLVERPKKAFAERHLGRIIKFHKSLDLLIMDELGHLPLDTEGAKVFSEVVSQEYEQGSIVLTPDCVKKSL
ncbi:MAG: hypothetical protein DRP27_03125 [Thermotogae bacterium]|nr:ATP-binding protein [Thermotogota bacterium]RKX45813.1 MAG: hypothetical protein DRP27_03125 [Thermotogota bacterium]